MTALCGVYVGTVELNVDPVESGRLLIRVPAVDPEKTQWAKCAWATHQLGGPPPAGAEVLVGFVGGDADYPIVIGRVDAMVPRPIHGPSVGVEDAGLVVAMRSRSGASVRVSERNKSLITVETPGGLQVTLDDVAGQIGINDGAGNSVVMTPTAIMLTASAKVRINAAAVEVNTGELKVTTGMAAFTGVLKSDTLITNNVVASSYTPGAGNVL